MVLKGVRREGGSSDCGTASGSGDSTIQVFVKLGELVEWL